jgi:hypothetical protein
MILNEPAGENDDIVVGAISAGLEIALFIVPPQDLSLRGYLIIRNAENSHVINVLKHKFCDYIIFV